MDEEDLLDELLSKLRRRRRQAADGEEIGAIEDERLHVRARLAALRSVKIVELTGAAAVGGFQRSMFAAALLIRHIILCVCVFVCCVCFVDYCSTLAIALHIAPAGTLPGQKPNLIILLPPSVPATTLPLTRDKRPIPCRSQTLWGVPALPRADSRAPQPRRERLPTTAAQRNRCSRPR